MKYLVIELQKSGDDVASIINKCDDLNQAQSTYHQILAAAAISSIEVHSAIIMNDEGEVYNRESFFHPIEPENSEE